MPLEPVAKKHLSCDFEILGDKSHSAPANGFQTSTADGRPMVVFTQALINKTKN
tara:strand:- start:204 stop:365 length:162 start_codon:yes stop_codon:yes gene_type:complete